MLFNKQARVEELEEELEAERQGRTKAERFEAIFLVYGSIYIKSVKIKSVKIKS